MNEMSHRFGISHTQLLELQMTHFMKTFYGSENLVFLLLGGHTMSHPVFLM